MLIRTTKTIDRNLLSTLLLLAEKVLLLHRHCFRFVIFWPFRIKKSKTSHRHWKVNQEANCHIWKCFYLPTMSLLNAVATNPSKSYWEGHNECWLHLCGYFLGVLGPGHLNKRFVYYSGLARSTIGQRQRTHCNSVSGLAMTFIIIARRVFSGYYK